MKVLELMYKNNIFEVFSNKSVATPMELETQSLFRLLMILTANEWNSN